MNRGHVLHRSPMQQMMAGNPNWWSINNMRPPPEHPSPYLPSPSSSSSSPAASSSSTVFPPYPPPASSLPLTAWHDNQELPESWSQLLLGGLVGEEERLFPSSSSAQMVDVKQESSESCYAHDHQAGNGEFLAASRSSWGQILPASSPASCVTAFSSSILDFSNTKTDGTHEKQDHSSECNSTANGSAFKKARVQSSSSQSPFKVRKEKLGDRITALHQLVSPFGKTDTASVLSEAIGYIRFLHSQIEALSSPYMGSAAAAASHNMRNPVQGEMNCIFPEDPGQLLNDNCVKRRGTPEKNIEGEQKDLRSRGLCLVPVSCTLQVGSSDNGADYWAPALGGGFR